ncbi:36394_t:CDS:1, partial [Gigaspora margarita]
RKYLCAVSSEQLFQDARNNNTTKHTDFDPEMLTFVIFKENYEV